MRRQRAREMKEAQDANMGGAMPANSYSNIPAYTPYSNIQSYADLDVHSKHHRHKHTCIYEVWYVTKIINSLQVEESQLAKQMVELPCLCEEKFVFTANGEREMEAEEDAQVQEWRAKKHMVDLPCLCDNCDNIKVLDPKWKPHPKP
uniref:Uncharacterized protein n=1 Tax=Ditylenchus dipsaci TaxID=166011 RepID=A0A915D521_9BILA